MSKIIGVEFTPNFIRVGVGSRKGKKVLIRDLYTYPIPRGLVNEGSITDPDFLANEMSKMWKEYKLPKKNILVGLSNRRIMVRTKTFTNIDKKNIKNMLSFIVEEDDIPVSVDQVNMDFFINKEKDNTLKGLLVAVPQKTIDPIVETFEKDSIRLAGIDISPLALTNSLVSNQYDSQKVAILDIETDWISITSVDKGVPVSVRFVNSQIQKLLTVIKKRLDVDEVGALKTFREIGIAETVSTEEERDIAIEINQAVIEIYKNISETLRYFNKDFDQKEYDAVIITGVGALIKNIEKSFQEALSAPVFLGNPFHNVEVSKKIQQTELNKIIAAVPIGLILGSQNA